MPLISILFGLALVGLGYESYTNHFDLFHVQKLHTPTALIPAYFGAGLVLCGLVALAPSAKKHAMHLAAMIGLLGLIGGGYKGFPSLPAALSGELENAAGPKVQSLMAAVCGMFLALCVNSFIQARKRRQAAAGK